MKIDKNISEKNELMLYTLFLLLAGVLVAAFFWG